MGCGVGRVMDIGIRIIKSNKTFNIQNDVKSKFIVVYRNNPFYTMSLNKLISITENFDKNSKSMHDYISSLYNLDNVTRVMIKEVYDIASNTLIAHKSTELDWIGLFVHDETGSSTITSGTMSIEVTLKNTNYNTIWWNL